MVVTRPRPDVARPTRLPATLYAYEFCNNLILLYPVYVLLFTDTGLSTAQVSSILVLWSLSGLVFEVPSGVWADAVSRRALLCVAPLFAGAAFGCWVFAPAYWSFALGAVLWGLQGALKSGAMEALVYEELDRLGAAHRYATVMGRARTAEVVAVTLAMLAAGPVFALGGYPAVGVASVAACVLAASVATAFPEHRSPSRHAAVAEEARDYLATLRAGLAEVRTSRPVRLAVLAVPAVVAIWGALDEYVPLLVRETGVGPTTVPLYVLLVWAGVTAGGLLAGPARSLNGSGLAAILTVAAVALATGALSGVPAGFLLVAVAFGLFQISTVLVDARLQHRISGPSRATVTSLAGLGVDVGTIAAYGMYAAASTVASHGVVFALAMLPYLAVAVAFHQGRSRSRGRTGAA